MSVPLPIALDAMGGDFGVQSNVDGAVAAARAGVAVLLVGDEAQIRAALAKHEGTSSLRLSVHHTDDVISMNEHASDIRSRKNASINVCTRLVRENKASAVVTMGHSGAAMASALLGLGRLKGVERPAMTTNLPAKKGMVTLLDVGANTDIKPVYLAHWALLATVYLQSVEGVASPSVGLLSIGEEDHKGNALVLEAHPLLRALDGRGISFHGNVEGRDVFAATTDIVVTDGFTGNVVLKLAEGEAKVLLGWVKEALMSTPVAKVGAMLARGALRGLAERISPSSYGASLLLGVNGLCFIGHGSSDDVAVKNSLLRAARAVDSDLMGRLRAALEDVSFSS